MLNPSPSTYVSEYFMVSPSPNPGKRVLMVSPSPNPGKRVLMVSPSGK